MKSTILLICLIYFSCETPEGHIGASRDISEAKKRGIFISEYTAHPNPCKLNDSLQLTIKEAWIENKWAYGKDNQTIIDEGYQLCINTTEADENKIDNAGGIFGVDFDHNLRLSGDDSFIGDFNYVPGDSIEYLLQHGRNFMNDSTKKKEIIGKLVLIRK